MKHVELVFCFFYCPIASRQTRATLMRQSMNLLILANRFTRRIFPMANGGSASGRASARRFLARGMATLIIAAGLASAPAMAHAATYLVNGILSATPIGYGFKNLKKKLPSAKLFLMVTGWEAGSIQNSIVTDIRARHASNPDEGFSLAGISAGADVVLKVARELASDGIPIHYLGVVESSGGSVPANVANVDNFICTGGSCSKRPLNTGPSTTMRVFRLDDGHINLGNNPTVHGRVISMAR
jgi:hypothetical protein